MLDTMELRSNETTPLERTHPQVKDTLRTPPLATDLPSQILWVLLGLRAIPKEDSSLSSAELLYRAPLVLPGQLPGFCEPPLAVFHKSTRAAPLPLSREVLHPGLWRAPRVGQPD